MVHGIVKKIMLTGINKYAKKYSESAENVQIKVTINEEGFVVYTMCKNFNNIENVGFIEIMDKKIDIFGYEQLATPFLGKCLVDFSTEIDVSPLNVSIFIIKYKESVVLAYYNGYLNIKNVTLLKQLESLGI